MTYKAQAHINSLNGELREITVLDKAGDTIADLVRVADL